MNSQSKKAVIHNIPPLVGTKEFAELLGWSKANLSTKFKRQREGRKVKNPLPEPVHILAATPVWTLEQAEQYKEELNRRDSV